VSKIAAFGRILRAKQPSTGITRTCTNTYIRGTLNPDNACHRESKNFCLPPPPPSEQNVKFRMPKSTAVFTVVLYGCETWWRNSVGWGCSRIGCWGSCTELRGVKGQENGVNYTVRDFIHYAPNVHQML
jgi:hypothetical protein